MSDSENNFEALVDQLNDEETDSLWSLLFEFQKRIYKPSAKRELMAMLDYISEKA